MTILSIETRDGRFQVAISEKIDGGYLAQYIGVRPRAGLPLSSGWQPPPGGVIVEGAVEASSLSDLGVKYRAVVAFHCGRILAEEIVPPARPWR